MARKPDLSAFTRNEAGQFNREEPREYFARNFEVNETTGCWNWTGNMFSVGYGQFKNRGFLGHGRAVPASRASWMLHNGPIPSRSWVLHKCDNRRCVNPAHLFLGSPKDNMQDCSKKRRINHGEDRPQSKLTEDKVRELRKLRAEGVSFKKLAAKYGVAVNCIVSTVKRITWSHVK